VDKEFIDYLKILKDIQTDTHSGSYELMTQGVACLANIATENIDVCDLEMLFHFGNLKHGKQARDKNIMESNLLEDDKKYMLELDEKIATGNYSNHKNSDNGNCGLFSKGKLTLIGFCDK